MIEMNLDFSYEEIQGFKDKQIRTASKSIKWIDSDECLYRGRVIRRYDNVPKGYGGRYSVTDKSNRHSFSKLSEAKTFIEKLIDTKTEISMTNIANQSNHEKN